MKLSSLIKKAARAGKKDIGLGRKRASHERKEAKAMKMKHSTMAERVGTKVKTTAKKNKNIWGF